MKTTASAATLFLVLLTMPALADCPANFTGEVTVTGLGGAFLLDNQAQVTGSDTGRVDGRPNGRFFVEIRDPDTGAVTGSAEAQWSVLASGTSLTVTIEASSFQESPGSGGFLRSSLELGVTAQTDSPVSTTGTVTTNMVDDAGRMTQTVETFGNIFNGDIVGVTGLARADTIEDTRFPNPRSHTIIIQVDIEASPLFSQSFSWVNAGGGSYAAPENWSPACGGPPSFERSDHAFFNLPSATFIPISSGGGTATATLWILSASMVDFSGSATVSFCTVRGGTLRHSGTGRIDTKTVGIEADGRLEIRDTVEWQNSDAIQIFEGEIELASRTPAVTDTLRIGVGTAGGSARATVGGLSTWKIGRELTIGDTFPGTLEIVEGGRVEVSQSTLEPVILGRTAAGTVNVRDDFSLFAGEGSLFVGGGSEGRLNVESAIARFPNVAIPGSGLSSGAGEVRVSGHGGALIASQTLFVNASAATELEANTGGAIVTKELVIGSSSPTAPGTAAELTLRRGDGVDDAAFELAVKDPALACCGETTLIGVGSPGRLNILSGARAQLLGGGLKVGAGSQGIVILSGLDSPGSQALLDIKGTTLVGASGPGIVQISDNAHLANEGNLFIGGMEGGSLDISAFSFLTVIGRCATGELGAGDLSVDSGSFATVRGALAVGSSGVGRLEVLNHSVVTCEQLEVGGTEPEASGLIIVNDGTLTTSGNGQVGIAAGTGEILLSTASSILEIGGTMTLGNPDGAAGGGGIAMVDATIEGGGSLIVNPNGHLTGTGTVKLCAACRVDAGGLISPGLSPGELEIDGNYRQLSNGLLLIEVAGLAPGQHDVLKVTGAVTLDGTVEFQFLDGFLPEEGDSFDFLNAGGAVTGNFAQITFPQLASDFAAELTLTPNGGLRLTARSDALPGDGAQLTPPPLGNGKNPAPFVQISAESGVLTLTWPTIPGRLYRLETTDLNPPDWMPIGDSTTAENSILSESFDILNIRQRYFRVVEESEDP